MANLNGPILQGGFQTAQRINTAQQKPKTPLQLAIEGQAAGATNLANKVAVDRQQMASNLATASPLRQSLTGSLQQTQQRLASPDFGSQPNVSAPSKGSTPSADQHGIVSTATAGGGRRYAAGTQMNSLPPVGDSNVPANMLNHVAARGSVAPMQTPTATRTIGPDGRVSVKGAPMFGRNIPSQLRAELEGQGFHESQPLPVVNQVRNARSNERMQAAGVPLPPNATLPKHLGLEEANTDANPRREAYQQRLADRRSQALAQRVANTQYQRATEGRGVLRGEDGQTDQVGTLAAALSGRAPKEAMAGLVGREEVQGQNAIANAAQALERERMQYSSPLDQAQMELAQAEAEKIRQEANIMGDPAVREQAQQAERLRMLVETLSSGVPAAASAALPGLQQILQGGSAGQAQGPMLPPTTVDPETGSVPDEQIGTLLSELINSQNMGSPDLLSALEGKQISRDRLNQYLEDHDPGAWEDLMDEASYAFTLPGNFESEQRRLTRKRKPIENLAEALGIRKARPINFK